jgi:hypothetical protein
MLGYIAGINHLQSSSPCSAWVMALMPQDMPLEAHCQEDRGINAEIWYILHFSRFNKSNYSLIAFS